MKKPLKIVLFVVSIGLSLYYIQSYAPIAIVKGNSMKPALNTGDLLVTEEVDPEEIQIGDIIVFNIIKALQKQYHYPPVVAHRVTKIERSDGEIVFRTKGDVAPAGDPFSVRPVDLKGKPCIKLPYAGLIVLYLHSQIGRITVSVAVTLLIVNSYSKELDEAKKKLGQKVFSPVLKEQRQFQGALNKLASATSEYAQNLASHTKAVKELAVTTKKQRKAVERIEIPQRKQGEKN